MLSKMKIEDYYLNYNEKNNEIVNEIKKNICKLKNFFSLDKKIKNIKRG